MHENSSGLRPTSQPLLVFYALLMDAMSFPRQGECCVTPVSYSYICFQLFMFAPSWLRYKCPPTTPLPQPSCSFLPRGLSTHSTICSRQYQLALLFDSIPDGELFLPI